MAIVHTLTIKSVKKASVVNDLNDVVTRVRFEYSASDQGKESIYYGNIKLPEPSSDGFIELENITKENIEAWVKANINEDDIKSRVDQDLDLKINPPEVITWFEWLPNPDGAIDDAIESGSPEAEDSEQNNSESEESGGQ